MRAIILARTSRRSTRRTIRRSSPLLVDLRVLAEARSAVAVVFGEWQLHLLPVSVSVTLSLVIIVVISSVREPGLIRCVGDGNAEVRRNCHVIPAFLRSPRTLREMLEVRPRPVKGRRCGSRSPRFASWRYPL